MEIALLRLESRKKSEKGGNENGDPLVECLVSVALLAVELIMSTIVWLIRTLNILPFGSSSGADTMFRVQLKHEKRKRRAQIPFRWGWSREAQRWSVNGKFVDIERRDFNHVFG